MGLTKRKDGYYVEFPVIDDGKVLTLARGVPGAKVKRWKTGTNNKTMAKQQEAMIKTDLMKGKIASEKARAIPFSEWAESYLALDRVQNLRTYKDRVNSIRLQMVPFFGKKPLNMITSEDVEAYRGKRMRKNGKKAALGTINNEHTMLKHMLSVAVQRGLLEVNVAKKVPIPNPNNERDRVLTQDEWLSLYENASPHLKPILLVAYHLGPRLGEILGLTWDRVDLKRGFIQLRSQDTKTKEPRLVPMTPEVKKCISELAKVRHLTTNHVFLYDGNSVSEIKRTFHTTKKKAGIENFRFHDLRHCAATNLRRAGVDTVTAMKIVGHKSERMHRRYNSVSEADLLAAASRINTYLTPTDSTDQANVVSY
jgi:integrase